MKPKPAAHHKTKISSVALNSDDVEGILPMNDSPTQAGSETEEGSKQKAVIQGNEKTRRFWQTVRRRFKKKN
uniref:Ubiquitin carboxyl-terminal hydrolase n=1 Tax=Nothobranchius pienaari TaxID=704102 RepID=A0A1A8LS68_9TELE